MSGAPAGNTNSAKGRLVTDSLRKAMLAQAGKGNIVRLNKMTEKVAKLAADGERWAVELVWDRLEGRAVNSLEVTGDAGLAINVIRFSAEPIEDRANIKVIENVVDMGTRTPTLAHDTPPIDHIPHKQPTIPTD